MIFIIDSYTIILHKFYIICIAIKCAIETTYIHPDVYEVMKEKYGSTNYQVSYCPWVKYLQEPATKISKLERAHLLTDLLITSHKKTNSLTDDKEGIINSLDILGLHLSYLTSSNSCQLPIAPLFMVEFWWASSFTEHHNCCCEFTNIIAMSSLKD